MREKEAQKRERERQREIDKKVSKYNISHWHIDKHSVC